MINSEVRGGGAPLGTRFTVRLITTSQWTCSRAVSRSSK